jgi:peptidylprolyl isomerase
MRGIEIKKTEKLKGKERVAAKKKQTTMIAVAAGVIIIVALASWFFFLNPSAARSGDTVSVYYTGALDDGTIFDSNVNGSPLIFTLGKGFVIPGFDEGVVGMAPNTTKVVHIPSEKAYGSYKNELIQVINRSAFPKDTVPIIGEGYTIRRDDGAVSYVRIRNITENSITIDENHELAGKDLTFTITLIGIVKQ